jgi:glycosyltransferase involved in cell wall biosynthesis
MQSGREELSEEPLAAVPIGKNPPSRRLRIAIIGARGVPARWGGYETFATEIGWRLVRRGIDVTIYCRTKYSLSDRPSEYLGVNLIYLPCIHGKGVESATHELISLLHASRADYDAIYVLGFRASPIYVIARLLDIPIFFNTDGLDWQRRKWGALARAYLRATERVAVRIAPESLISDSRAIARYFEKRYGVRPEYLTYGANQVMASGTTALIRYQLVPKSYFLVVARLEPENNVDHIIRQFKAAETDKTLVVAGDVNYRSDYAESIRAEASEMIRFIGGIYEPGQLDQLFFHSYAYIHGHEVGGTNPALVQAMGCGACILSNEVPYNVEVLGEAGIYWSTSTDSLADELGRVSSAADLAAELGEAARERARSSYNWEAVADQYEAYFRDRLDRVVPTAT